MTYTEQERIDARRVTWQKYNRTHKQERAKHNKEYVQRDDIKQRRRILRNTPKQLIIDKCVGPTTKTINIHRNLSLQLHYGSND